MKTNIIQALLTAVFVGAVALIATSKRAVDFSVLAEGISYTAVVIMIALAAVDSRRNDKKHAAR
jgi:hypothetical protein